MLCFTAQSVLYVGKCSMQTSGEHVFCCCWIECSVNISWIKVNDIAIYMVIYIFVDFLSAHLLIFCLLINYWQEAFSSVQFSSVIQSCPTLCDPMDCTMPGFPIQQLPELAQTHVHWVADAILPFHSVIPFSSCPQSFPVSGFFPMSQFFTSGGQSISVSASASVLPMNNQDWFPLEWTGWISLKLKGLSRVFSNTTVQKNQFFSAQLSLWSNSHMHTWLLEIP